MKALIAGISAGVAGIAVMMLDPFHECDRHRRFTTTAVTRSRCGASERTPAQHLKTICIAQADFRAHDRDADGIRNYWPGDIAGLYTQVPKGGTSPVKLIELGVAAADERPVSPMSAYGVATPRSGYWLRALRKAGGKELDPLSQFAACAYPADYPKSGRWTYVVNEDFTIYRKDLGRGGGVEDFPDDAALKKEWEKLD